MACYKCHRVRGFNTQPPEGGWIRFQFLLVRAKSFNTQPPEGGWGLYTPRLARPSSFNTQPPEGGWSIVISYPCIIKSFNTQPPEGGWPRIRPLSSGPSRFQHTAARRRLVKTTTKIGYGLFVSTHSRPKAAGHML